MPVLVIQVWQVLQCAVCSPDIGVLNNTALEQEDDRVPVCLRYCESVFNECATSQFAGDEVRLLLKKTRRNTQPCHLSLNQPYIPTSFKEEKNLTDSSLFLCAVLCADVWKR